MDDANGSFNLLDDGSDSVVLNVDQLFDTEGGWLELEPHLLLSTRSNKKSDLGSIGELLVWADLISRGYEVYVPLPNRKPAYDAILIHQHTGKVVRLSVKSTCDGTSVPTHFRGMRQAHSAFVRYLGPSGYGYTRCVHCGKQFSRYREEQTCCSSICSQTFKKTQQKKRNRSKLSGL